jgi:alcohol dehydrogenase (cytochrome c)
MRLCGSAVFVLAAIVLTSSPTLPAQSAATDVTYRNLLDGLKDPTKWLTYSGEYNGQRHSPLTQITPENVTRLAASWTFQTGLPGNFQATPIVLDGVIYITGNSNNVWAIDARTGRQIWRYRRDLPSDVRGCCGAVNRGLAALGDRLFLATFDAHLVALDMKTGGVLYDVQLEDYKLGYSGTAAPLVVKDKVIVGIAGAEYGIRGFIDGYDAQSGKRLWRFYTVPGPGEAGSDTWPAGDAYQHGGGSIWVTGSFDPELNLVFFGTGNPGPDYYGAEREGDNLYTSSLVALDPDTGKLRWHYQFTPHDTHDWDATQVPVLADLPIGGQSRKVVMFANRNGFFYTLDRLTGKVLVAKPFIETTWAKELGPTGRPILLPGNLPDEAGTRTCPQLNGGTSFMSPSYDPASRTFFVTARETCAIYHAWHQDFVPGRGYSAGATRRAPDHENYSALRAIDPVTGTRKWEYRYPNTSTSSPVEISNAGILSTASGLVFTGDADGNLLGFDSRTGKNVWHYQLGYPLRTTGGTTYMLDGRQQLLVPAGMTLTAFTLRE